MAGYRPWYKRFWKDPDIQELEKDDKYLFIYISTNEAVTESGIYYITPRTIANETGLDVAFVSQRLSDGFYKNVIYDPANRLIFVKKIHKHSTGGRPDLIRKSIVSDFNMSSCSNLWQDFIVEYPQYKELLNGCSTVDEPLAKPAKEEAKTDYAKLNFDEYVSNILKVEPKYKSLDIDEERHKFILYNEKKHRILKDPKLGFRNWLNNAIKYDKEKEDGTHRSDNQASGNPEGNTGRDKFVRGKYGKVVKR